MTVSQLVHAQLDAGHEFEEPLEGCIAFRGRLAEMQACHFSQAPDTHTTDKLLEVERDILPGGFAGVDVFFVISGFIMWSISARESRPAAFMVNRIVRITPLYWLATGVMIFGALAGLFPRVVLTPDHIVNSLLFIPHVSPSNHQVWPLLVQGWTLNYEMFFYALFALTLFAPRALQALLCVAGIACCVAMAMPQVHIVAYCGDLGYGVARGAEMLSIMLASGIVSRIASGFIADRIGGLGTLLIGSFMQMVALALYLLFDGLMSLYIISALFGLFQGGIVPSYALIVREFFPPREAGMRVGVVIFATVIGMALGGWMSGLIFDVTGSYAAAFVHGILWNMLNLAIAGWLLLRVRGGGYRMAPA